jgi:hypothetical protein
LLTQSILCCSKTNFGWQHRKLSGEHRAAKTNPRPLQPLRSASQGPKPVNLTHGEFKQRNRAGACVTGNLGGRWKILGGRTKSTQYQIPSAKTRRQRKISSRTRGDAVKSKTDKKNATWPTVADSTLGEKTRELQRLKPRTRPKRESAHTCHTKRDQIAGIEEDARTGKNQRAEGTEIRPERHESKSPDLLLTEPAHEDMTRLGSSRARGAEPSRERHKEPTTSFKQINYSRFTQSQAKRADSTKYCEREKGTAQTRIRIISS